MTIDINELRRLAKAATPPQGWYVQLGDYIYGEKDVTDGEEWEPVIVNTEEGGPVNFEVSVAAFISVANPAAVLELLDRLEAAESDALEQARLNRLGSEREAALIAKPTGTRAVVVVDRGWIFAGDVERKDGFIHLSRALHVFRWAEIGFAGIIENTTKADLRPIADVQIPAGAEIFCVPVPDDWGL